MSANEWSSDRRTESYLNDEGNLDLEITEFWNEDVSAFELNRKLEYEWDSMGYDLILEVFRWDANTSIWTQNEKTTRVIIDDNGSTEMLSQRWDDNLEIWKDDRTTTILLNEAGRMNSIKRFDWDANANSWIPSFDIAWTFDSITNNRTALQEFQVWDVNIDDWKIKNMETFEYFVGSQYSIVSDFDWNESSESFRIASKDFYYYSPQEIIVDVPPKPHKPIGSDTICLNSENIVYKTSWKSDIKSFLWSIIPENAGIFEAKDSLMSLTLNMIIQGNSVYQLPAKMALVKENIQIH